MDEQAEDKKPAKRKYGYRSKKFWFLVYLIVGAVIYFIIYWFWIRKSSSGGGLY